MPKEIEITAALAATRPIIDVRSPGEFLSGHMVGAVNIPLFSNDERAEVGTVYKQQSREAALALGRTLVEPKLQGFVDESFKVSPYGKVVVHCWRGGMRSKAFADHLTENGFAEAQVISGGYKAYRAHLLEAFAKTHSLKILGGYTGSGKTPVLEELAKNGHQVVDLEGLAHHKGSAFGGIDQGSQPTVEQFENDLYAIWRKLDPSKPIWIEDESHNIGAVRIPMSLYTAMRNAPVYFLDIPKEARAKKLAIEYGKSKNEDLGAAIKRIAKRLGGQNEKEALAYLEKGDYYEVAMIALGYYDKYYLKGLNKRNANKVRRITLSSTDPKLNIKELEKLEIWN